MCLVLNNDTKNICTYVVRVQMINAHDRSPFDRDGRSTLREIDDISLYPFLPSSSDILLYIPNDRHRK